MTRRLGAVLALACSGLIAVISVADAPGKLDPVIKTGRLLLNGTLVSPPYRIDFDGTTLELNGREIARLHPIVKPVAEPLDLDTPYGLSQYAIALHLSLDALAGPEVALATVKALLENDPIVESVAPRSESSLNVKFRDEPFPVLIVFRKPVDPVQVAQARAASLRHRARTIEQALRQDRLLVLHRGVWVYTAAGTGPSLAKSLLKTAGADMSIEARRAAVASVIPDRRTARLVADQMTARKAVTP
jgi:hypothetical protein